MEEAVARLRLASDAGADVCFIEGVKTKELLETTVAALAPKPVSSNMHDVLVILTSHAGPCQRHLWWAHPIIYYLGG